MRLLVQYERHGPTEKGKEENAERFFSGTMIIHDKTNEVKDKKTPCILYNFCSIFMDHIKFFAVPLRIIKVILTIFITSRKEISHDI